MSKVKLNKVEVQVESQVKVDNRVNNTGRPVNKKSSRQIRLRKQKLYSRLNKQFVSGKKFKINNSNTEYTYHATDPDSLGLGHISNEHSHVCNVSYIGRTKVLGYTFVLNKRVNVELNLKYVKFVK